MLPMLLKVELRNERHNFRLWIPLILLYLILAPLYLLLLIAYPFVRMIEGAQEVKGFFVLCINLPRLFTAMIGTEVEVDSKDSRLLLFIE